MKATTLLSNLAILAVLVAPAAWAAEQPQNAPGAAEERATRDNTDLEYRVKAALKNDERVGASKIDVSTKNDVVYLSGLVDSEVDRNRAIAVASRVSGVSRVDDKIQIGGGGR